MAIHPTALIDPQAELGPEVSVDAYSIIDAHVTIGARTRVGPHVRITGRTTIGEDCAIHSHAVLGEPPQDRKFHPEMESFLRIGHRNIIREFVTMHLAVGEGNATIVGDDNMLMAYCHIGHNCLLGNCINAANYVGLSGGCRIDDRVVLGGMSGLHQYVHIGRMSMVGGYCKVSHDVPPFVIIDGVPPELHGLNAVGLRRGGFAPEVRVVLKQAYRALYHETRNLTEVLREVRDTLRIFPEVEEFLAFVERSGRGGRHLDPSRKRCGV